MKLRVGLIGFGLAGRILHVPLIRTAGMEIVGVVTSQVTAAGALLPAARVHADIESLLAESTPDLVVIASPNHLHRQQAMMALQAGAHDKPMALRAEDAQQLIRAAAAARRLLSVFHNRRWDSDFLTVRRLLGQADLGELHHFEARWERFSPTVRVPWKGQLEAGGGMLNDLGPHLIDQVLCLFGRPEWLQADIYTQRRGAAVDDAFEIRLGRGALRIVLGASSLVSNPAPRFLVHGAAGTYTKYGLDVQEAQLKEGMQPGSIEFGIEPESQWGVLKAGATGATQRVPAERGNWLLYYQCLQRSIANGEALPVSGSDALAVLSIIEAARRSSASGSRVSL